MITPIEVPRYVLGLHSRVPKKSRKIVVLKWLKGNGEAVVEGEAVLVLDTRKATVEMVSPASGLFFHLVELDVKVKVGDILALVAGSAEEYREYQSRTAAQPSPVPSESQPVPR
jgi:pyruvate/2-oxoglutarate dehydrogenase complex dihydrolipoamide acyltransferase (E2) component